MERKYYLDEVKTQLRIHSVCALLGPRQVGKTTLAEEYLKRHPKDKVHFFDLQNPFDLAILENPMLVLSELTDQLIIIDEIQLRPELFPILRFLVDQKEKKQKFLILGSASRDLIRQSSESLAGRIGYIEMEPFSLFEVQEKDRLFVRGGFPRSFLADNDEDSYKWRQSYITTFLERDIPSLGFQIPPHQIRRFWLMLAHYHGQIFNASEIGRTLGVSDHTVRRYLDILVGTFMMRLLQPWFENLGKRQVKSPKVYFRDIGILNAMVGLQNREQLIFYPKLGAFWEGFALEEIVQYLHAQPEECYFWSTQTGAELDLLIVKDGKKNGFEFKYADTPSITKSMKIALHDLKLDHLFIVYPGVRRFPLDEKITAIGLNGEINLY